jgi:hypothetical protein
MHALDSTRIFLLSLVIVATPLPVFAQESLCGNPFAEQWTVKVGMGVSAARFSLPTPADVQQLLHDITRTSEV